MDWYGRTNYSTKSVVLQESRIKWIYFWYNSSKLYYFNSMYQKHMTMYIDINDPRDKITVINEYIDRHLELFEKEFNKYIDTYILDRVKLLDKQLNEIKEFVIKYKQGDELEYTKALVITNLAERYLEHLNSLQELMVDKWKFQIFQTTFTRIKDAYQHILSGKKE